MSANPLKVEVHEYNRLSTLHVEEHPIRSIADFKAGDCIVAFSRKSLFQIKHAVNKHMNK